MFRVGFYHVLCSDIGLIYCQRLRRLAAGRHLVRLHLVFNSYSVLCANFCALITIIINVFENEKLDSSFPDSPDIVYDWVNKRLYIVAAYQRQIRMTNVDGSNVVTVLNVDSPRAIALHPCRGYFRVLFCFVLILW